MFLARLVAPAFVPTCRDAEVCVEAGPVVQWHVTWSTHARLPVAPDEARRRAIVRALIERLGAVLALFCVVDDHVHVWLIGSKDVLVKRLRSVEYALEPLVAAPLGPRHVEVVERKGHREWLVGYLLTQGEHHGLPEHPAVWSGGALPDLVGARVLGWKTRLFDALPRLRLGDVYTAVGLPRTPLIPITDDALGALGAAGVLAAVTATLGADPALVVRDPINANAIATAARICRDLGLSISDLARSAGRVREGVSRAARRAVRDEVLRAVRLRVALERAAIGAVVPKVADWKQELVLRMALDEGPPRLRGV